MIREPTWYFQSKLLVSYNRKDNMSGEMCQQFRGIFRPPALFSQPGPSTFQQFSNALMLFARKWKGPGQDDRAGEHECADG